MVYSKKWETFNSVKNWPLEGNFLKMRQNNENLCQFFIRGDWSSNVVKNIEEFHITC